jgi:acetoin utilization protein AcuC
MILWDPALLGYHLGDHPMDPVRVELTIELARALGVLDRPDTLVEAPAPAGDEALFRVHRPAYVAAVRAAAAGEIRRGFGFDTPDTPVFSAMHTAADLIAGATVRAAEAVWHGEVRRAVNVAGGLHHAMPDHASGFCVYNDPAVAIARLLDLGAERVAYVDVDVHHGDGVQEIFYADPRVLTVSIHESGRTLFPGTGFPAETGAPGAEGCAVNVALPPGTGDTAWLRAFHAVVPGVVRAFDPQILVTQCGADGHRSDPLANLKLTVDGQRATYIALRALADEVCEGRWVATGGGGYALVECVPRAWTHLLAVATGAPIDPATVLPERWRALAVARRTWGVVPRTMTDGGMAGYQPWHPGDEMDAVDRAVLATRRQVYPHFGLDPYDPRD